MSFKNFNAENKNWKKKKYVTTISADFLSLDGYLARVERVDRSKHSQVTRPRLIWLIGQRRVVSLRYRSGYCGLRGCDPIRGMPRRPVNHLHRDTLKPVVQLATACCHLANLRIYGRSIQHFADQEWYIDADVISGIAVSLTRTYQRPILDNFNTVIHCFEQRLVHSFLVTCSTELGGERTWSVPHC